MLKSQKLTQIRLREIRKFWFGHMPHSGLPNAEKILAWTQPHHPFNNGIRQQFLADMLMASEGHGKLPKQAFHQLTWIILLDQFPRRIFNYSHLAYSQEIKAQEHSAHVVDNNLDHKFKWIEKLFLYLPYTHREDLDAQEKSIELFQQLLSEVPESNNKFFQKIMKFSLENHKIIKQFGRFPERNKVLNRTSTSDEMAYLSQCPQRDFMI